MKDELKPGDKVLVSGVEEKDNYFGTHIYNGKVGTIRSTYNGAAWVHFPDLPNNATEAFAIHYLVKQ